MIGPSTLHDTTLSCDNDLERLLSLSEKELEEIYQKALGQLPSKAPIYLPTERIPAVDRITGVRHVARIYKHDLDAVYRPRMRDLRERYKNRKRCFLIGNGPSLNRTDLSMLKDEVTFAVNGFFLKARDLDWLPTFYLVEDHLVAEDRAPWIRALKGPVKLFPAYLGYVFSPDEDTVFYNHRPRKSYPHGFDFSLDADKITYTGCTVTFSMMQIAAYFGFEEIYLIGVDASYDIPGDAKNGNSYNVGVIDMQSDDPNHFDPNYFGKGYRWHDPQVSQMINAYEEAKRTLEPTSQRIYNATIGGQLNVFERRSFHDLFPEARSPERVERDNAKLRNDKYPRLLVLDMTAMGNGTATGEIKSALFAEWPADRIMQIARYEHNQLQKVTPNPGGTGYACMHVSPSSALSEIDGFGPEVVLYRPVPGVNFLHEFAMQTIRQSTCPLITWIMDDWPAELAEKDPGQFSVLGADLTELLSVAHLNLSICDKMSEAFGQRYNTTFMAFANGINPVHWTNVRHHSGCRLHIRYAGGLAPNMNLDSVVGIAKSVETLAENGYDISLEINTQGWWLRDYGHHFKDFRHTSIESVTRSPEDYRAWLVEADAVLVAYNFDEDSLRYVRYSMANKMPECLASGATVIAHGPMDAATIEYLASTGSAHMIPTPETQEVTRLLRDLLLSPAQRNSIARKARDISIRKHNIIDLREKLRREIADVARRHEGSLRHLIGLGIAPDIILTHIASCLLIDPCAILELLEEDPIIRNFVDNAVSSDNLSHDIRLHFDEAIQFAGRSRQTGIQAPDR